MARAKCRICKATLDTKTAYKVVDKNGKSAYYCSQTEYDAEEERKRKTKEDKDKVYYLICDMFGYEIQNTQFFAEWTLWNKLRPNDIIYKYLRENEEYLQQICDRSYNNEYQRIRYFSAVLKNSLRDYKPKVEEKVVEKKIDTTFYDISDVINKPKRIALDDLEDEV